VRLRAHTSVRLELNSDQNTELCSSDYIFKGFEQSRGLVVRTSDYNLRSRLHFSHNHEGGRTAKSILTCDGIGRKKLNDYEWSTLQFWRISDTTMLSYVFPPEFENSPKFRKAAM
jgi:hypothetical protein